MPTATFDRNYFCFYMEGREDPPSAELDFDKHARLVLSGSRVDDVARTLAADLMKDEVAGVGMDAWKRKRTVRDDVATCGGDFEMAWHMLVLGRIESLSRDLELAILEECVTLIERGDDEESTEGTDA